MIKHCKIEIKIWDKGEKILLWNFFLILIASWYHSSWKDSTNLGKKQSIRARVFLNDSIYDLSQSQEVTWTLAFEESRGSVEPPAVKRRAGCPLTLSMMRLFHLYRLLPSHCPSLMCIHTLCLQVPQSAMEWMAQCAPVLSRFRLFLGTFVAWSLPGILACLSVSSLNLAALYCQIQLSKIPCYP